MQLSIMEEAVVLSALKRYIAFCNDCRENPENASKLAFIEGDISIASSLIEKLEAANKQRGY